MTVVTGEIVDDSPLGGYDTLCLELDIFPEHVCAEYDAIRAAADAAVSRIGEDARRGDFEALPFIEGTVIDAESK